MAVKEVERKKRTSEEDPEAPPTKMSHLNPWVVSFQKKLKKKECIEALGDFVKNCQKAKDQNDPAVQFLRGGGQFADILTVLNHCNIHSYSEISAVFSALHVLLLRVVTEVSEQHQSAEEMCHHLLNNYLNIIHKMLKVKSPAYSKKAVLKLLTAIITLSPRLARDILSYVSFPMEEIDAIVCMSRPDDPQNVRICFIQFLMAFLVEGNISVIRLLLEKRLILMSIVPQLQYDPSNLVIFVLTTFRTKLVKVKEISKTQKVYVFNTRVMLHLLKLYDWKGPTFDKRKYKNADNEVSHSFAVDLEQQEAVAEAVHALLLVLCSSYTYGIGFRDSTLDTTRLNSGKFIANVVKEINQPWENKFLTDLSVNIAQAFPEMTQILYAKVVSVIQPRASSHWVKAVTYVTKIFSALNLSELTALEPCVALSRAKEIATPIKLVNSVAISGLLYGHPVVHQKTIELLKAMLGLIEKCITIFSGPEAVAFQNHIMEILPNATVLEKAWGKALENSIPEKSALQEPIPNQTQQMSSLLDLMFLYQKYTPLLLDPGETHSDLASLMAKSLNLEDESNDNDKVLALKVKIMQLLLLLDTSVLEPEKSEFIPAVGTLLQASCRSDALSLEAASALGAFLLKYRVLESAGADATGELGIWIHSIQAVKSSRQPVVLSFLQEIFVAVLKNPGVYIEQSLKAQEISLTSTNIGKIKHATLLDQTDQIFKELLGMVASEKLNSQEVKNENEDRENACFKDISNTVELSSVFMCVLEAIESKETLEAPIKKYLSFVFVHLLHLQADPGPFLTTVRRWSSIPLTLLEYLESWNGDQPIVLTKPFSSSSPETSISSLLLEPKKTLPELKDCSDPTTILLLERLVVFHIAQLAEKYQLTENVTAAGLEILTVLLETLQETISQHEITFSKKILGKFFSIFLKQPTLLSYFSPLHKKNQIIERLVSNLLLDFLGCTAISKYSAISKDCCVLLKERFLRNILHHVNCSEVPTNNHTLLAATKLLALTDSEMCNLISVLHRKMGSEPWSAVVSYLLCNVNCLPSELVRALVNSFVDYLGEGETSSTWKVVDSFHQYLQRFPHCLPLLSPSLFEMLACKKGLNLASFILCHHQSYVPIFTTLVEQNISILTDPNIVFPLLSSASQLGPLPFSLLQLVYNQYKQEVIEAMQPPLVTVEYFENNADVVQQLILECMDSEVCQIICLSLVKNWRTLGLLKKFHLSVICGLKKKSEWKKHALTVVHLLVKQLKQMLQMKVSPVLIQQLCSLLKDILEDTKMWHKQTFEISEVWDNLPAFILQRGLSGTDQLTDNLFSTFVCLLLRAKETKMASQVFQMTTSHSCFLDIVLAKEHAGLKLAVLQLVLTCYKLSPLVMKTNQIPVWLGAYGASLSHCDQVILKILHCLSTNRNIDLSSYRPFLWGDAAVDHYSVRSRAGMSLWRVPQATVVINLLKSKMIDNTIAKFPIHRKLLLRDLENMPDMDAFNEDLEPSQPDIYDPAFMLPLMSHITAPESVVLEHKFMCAGGLALALIAMGSECNYMRSAALSVLARFHSRLNPNKPSEQLTVQLIESVRAGIGDLMSCRNYENSNSTSKKKKLSISGVPTDIENENLSLNQSQECMAPKVPNLSAVFIARASLVLTDPSHALYKPLHLFLLAKPALDFNIIPEFLEFVRPGTTDFSAYQQWLMESIHFGMRTEDDLDIARRVHLFKIICTLFTSSLSYPRIRKLILHILEATLIIPSGSTTLIKSGILPWLYATSNSLQKKSDGGLIIAFIRVIVALKKDAPSLVNTVVPFLLKLPRVIEVSDLHSVLQVAFDCIRSISLDHLVVLLHLSKRVLDYEIIKECSSLLSLTTQIEQIILNEELNETGADNKDNNVELVSLSDLLKSVVNKWLTLNYLPHET